MLYKVALYVADWTFRYDLLSGFWSEYDSKHTPITLSPPILLTASTGTASAYPPSIKNLFSYSYAPNR